MRFTVDSAKDFLLSKLSEQAFHDQVVLDEVEKSMFFFSQNRPNLDPEIVSLFDAKYDDGGYESKIRRLLRRSYARDKKN